MILDAIIWGLIGAFVGWNVPQPFWATYAQEKWIAPAWNKVKEKFKG